MKVRMYRQGLGDCFLLSFPRRNTRGAEAREHVHVLIDCGVLLGTKAAQDTMQRVVRDIAEKTGGHLDVVVGTHEHWDHLSGFQQAQEEFEAIDFGEVWLGWTEDPADDQARALSKDREARAQALVLAMARMEEHGLASSPAFSAGTTALNFLGIDTPGLGSADALRAAAKKTLGTRGALDYLRKRGGRTGTKLTYQEPGTHFLLPGTEDVRVFVLGPPRNERFIRKDAPSKSEPETYEAMALSGRASLAAAFQREEGGFAEQGAPFESFHRVSLQDARSGPSSEFFRKHYGFEPGDVGEEWRRIDGEWLSTAEQLSLALDSDTNNTSLVLAFELGAGGPVLLFAADAQVGNWLSWQELEFNVGSGPARRRVTADDLLERTVLYKVGHHGSHNATLREHGLEKMKSRELRALIPVSIKMAQKKKWRMPFPSLLTRLEQKCRERVVQSDNPPVGKRWVTFDELGVDVEIPPG